MKKFTISDMYSSKWKKRVEYVVFPSGLLMWLLETFGGGNGHRYWTNNNSAIYFANEKDFNWFLLRWA